MTTHIIMKKVYASVLGDEKSLKLRSDDHIVKMVKERNSAGKNGYTTVEILTKKRLRIYHEETYNKKPKIEEWKTQSDNKQYISYHSIDQVDSAEPEDDEVIHWGSNSLKGCDETLLEISENFKDTLKSNQYIKPTKWED